jgi:hypothetical protein
MFDHDVFWIAGIGALSFALVVDAAGSLLLRGRSVWIPAAWCLCAGLLFIAGVSAVRQLNDRVEASKHPPAAAVIARTLAQDLETYMATERVSRPLIKIDQDAWEYVAGAILELQKRGRPVSVEEDWVVMFTPEFRATGREDAVVTIAMPPEHLRLTERGVRMISAHEPVYAHVSERTTP